MNDDYYFRSIEYSPIFPEMDEIQPILPSDAVSNQQVGVLNSLSVVVTEPTSSISVKCHSNNESKDANISDSTKEFSKFSDSPLACKKERVNHSSKDEINHNLSSSSLPLSKKPAKKNQTNTLTKNPVSHSPKHIKKQEIIVFDPQCLTTPMITYYLPAHEIIVNRVNAFEYTENKKELIKKLESGMADSECESIKSECKNETRMDHSSKIDKAKKYLRKNYASNQLVVEYGLNNLSEKIFTESESTFPPNEEMIFKKIKKNIKNYISAIESRSFTAKYINRLKEKTDN